VESLKNGRNGRIEFLPNKMDREEQRIEDRVEIAKKRGVRKGVKRVE
jgi:hypothetical protein